jgi:hypothetical protein
VFPAGLLGLLLLQREAYVVALPAALAEATVKAAVRLVAGGAAEAGSLSASAVELTEEVLGSLSPQGWGRRFSALVLAAVLALLATGLLAYHVWGGQPAGSSAAAASCHH